LADREDHIDRTPFKKSGENVIRLSREHQRHRRLRAAEGEALLAGCSPHLRALLEAALETGCRRGELLSLQWHQVRFEPKAELFLPAQETKTKSNRTPSSERL
jgi:integrase